MRDGSGNGGFHVQGKRVSFSCSTDPSTGQRGCTSGSVSWQCATSADTGDTGCSGTTGAYACQTASSGPSERCTGVHTFSCYDQTDGRVCGGAFRSDPDCYFEPIFGAFCRY
ncbi:MAG: hypothetical protein ACXVEG_12560 [Actinomycetota bacterium]